MDIPSITVIALMALVLATVWIMRAKNKADLPQRTKLLWSLAGWTLIMGLAAAVWWIAQSQISN